MTFMSGIHAPGQNEEDSGPTQPEGFNLDTHVLDDFTDQTAHMQPPGIYQLLVSHVEYYDTDELRDKVPFALAFFKKRKMELGRELGLE